jgi:hypothetical protein
VHIGCLQVGCTAKGVRQTRNGSPGAGRFFSYGPTDFIGSTNKCSFLENLLEGMEAYKAMFEEDDQYHHVALSCHFSPKSPTLYSPQHPVHTAKCVYAEPIEELIVPSFLGHSDDTT